MTIIDSSPRPTGPWPLPHLPAAGWSTAQGRRSVAADAAAVHCAGPRFGAAIGDGIGESPDAARAAAIAVEAAAEVAIRSGAWDAVHAAAAALRHARETTGLVGDCVLAVAAGGSSGWSVAWAGDCRAYAVVDGRAWQLSSDHTVAAYLRAHGVAPAALLDHVVTSTAGQPTEIGWVRGPQRCDAIVLVTDGVYSVLDEQAIAAIVGRADEPVVAARELTSAALAAGSGDNVGAVVISHPF
ncbi:PP2C family protein-serine/threonine phosphatase [Pseudonocardia sp. GCM10023141]|uniref:PP2C family protein-serine/threonine phosphatase n=1 Tax=Pseudonocardia sp. GCM10023141 TaxID=3252653 RepID=UPI003610027F